MALVALLDQFVSKIPSTGSLSVVYTKSVLYRMDSSRNLTAYRRGTGVRGSFNGMVANVFDCTGFLVRYVCKNQSSNGTQSWGGNMTYGINVYYHQASASIISKGTNVPISTSQKSDRSINNGLVGFSQAILANQTLYVSGLLGMDPHSQLVCGGAEAQTRQALENLKHVLVAGGASLESVVKTTILLARMGDFQVVNQVYAEYFPKDCPARATFQVGKLPLDAAVEIEAIALSGDLVVAEAGPCPCARV